MQLRWSSRCARQAVKYILSQIINIRLDQGPWQPALVDPAFGPGIGVASSGGPFQCLWFYDKYQSVKLIIHCIQRKEFLIHAPSLKIKYACASTVFKSRTLFWNSFFSSGFWLWQERVVPSLIINIYMTCSEDQTKCLLQDICYVTWDTLKDN